MMSTDHNHQGLIEVLTRSGHVRQRIAWRGEEMTVGRAYVNDIILDDPYICPRHALLCPAGTGVEIKDLGSINGIYRHGGRERGSRLDLSGGETIRLGHTHLRFRPADYQVKTTLKDIAAFGPLKMFSRPWLIIAFAVLALASMLGDAALEASEPFKLSQAGGDVFVPLLGVLAWVGFWSLINYTTLQQWNFLTHLGIASFFLILWFLLSNMLALFAFGLSWDGGYPWLERLLRWLVFGTMLLVHLRYATRGGIRWQSGVAFSLTALLLAWGALERLQVQSEFDSRPKVEPLIKPPAFKLAPGKSVDDFFAEAASLETGPEKGTE